jgi:PmbA protein
MIEKLLNASLELFDDSEIYYKEEVNTSVRYGNGDLRSISSNRISGVMMRVKRGGRLGIASATTLDDPLSLLEQAAESARYGDEIPYSFSVAAEFPEVKPYSQETSDYPTEKMIEICEQAKADILKELPDISINITVEKEEENIQIATSGGTRAQQAETGLSFVVSAPIRGAGMSVYRFKIEIAPFEYPEEAVREFIRRYRWTENKVTPATKRMPVIWAPQAMDMFALALCTGISGEELYKKTSPLMDKYDKQILSEKLTLFDDPHSPRPGARGFDDEGVPTEKRALVQKGVLKSFLLDLRTGAKLGARSSGNGFKRALFGGGTGAMPNPWPANLWLEPDDSSLDEMIASLDEGILLTGGMGFHSSNYSQGQIAVRAVGYMIEKGQVTGRLEGTMLSGNIYEEFKHVRAVSKEIEQGHGGFYPYVLVEEMQVVGK